VAHAIEVLTFIYHMANMAQTLDPEWNEEFYFKTWDDDDVIHLEILDW
jgi:hypothetical protein